MKLHEHIKPLLKLYDLQTLNRPQLVRCILFERAVTPSLGQVKATIKRHFQELLDTDSLPRCFNGYCGNLVRYSGNLCTDCLSDHLAHPEWYEHYKKEFENECLFPGKCPLPPFHYSDDCIEPTGHL